MGRWYQLLFVLFVAFVATTTSWAGPRLRDICRVKGQEANTLHGLGLVVGLNGTGDPNIKPTARALATTLRLMGNPLAPGHLRDDALSELKDAKNVALVFVTATVPAAGARQGDEIQCEVSAISAKSLSGGRLMLTPLLGPRPGVDRVYAFAQGSIETTDPDEPTVGHIHTGCRMEEDFRNEFFKDHKLTLVLDKNHAGFGMANSVADSINSYNSGATPELLARAVDQINVEVDIPELYWDDPVVFVADILRRSVLSTTEAQARVVLDEATGTVVVGADVEIGPVAVTHGNVTVETGGDTFVGIDLEAEERVLDAERKQTDLPEDGTDVASGNIRLQALVNALNAVRVPSADIIDIIRKIDESGQLYGKVVAR
ncbi:MAG: flagellar basal body P-ring protein FlgI [Pirellulaceae bacterium]|nr:flagellar basal body P-ring protein FlgI [Pirellulaceae bacterium]